MRMMYKKIAKNFIYGEICGFKSENIPNEIHLINAMAVVYNILQPVRDRFGTVIVTSFQRNHSYNKRIGGSETSDHLYGKAVDFQVKGFSKMQMKTVFRWMFDYLEYKQLIFEEKNGTIWIHAAFDFEDNKKETLIAEWCNFQEKMIYKAVN